MVVLGGNTGLLVALPVTGFVVGLLELGPAAGPDVEGPGFMAVVAVLTMLAFIAVGAAGAVGAVGTAGVDALDVAGGRFGGFWLFEFVAAIAELLMMMINQSVKQSTVGILGS